MKTRRVRVGALYVFRPVWWDRAHPSIFGMLHDGDLVRVVNVPGCPRANTMGHCYVEKDGRFAGMVCTNSLIPRREA